MKEFTQAQQDLIYGSLLGDAHLQVTTTGKVRFSWNHGAVQYDYLRCKEAVLKDHVGTATKLIKNAGYGEYNARLTTLTHPRFKEVLATVGKPKKINSGWVEKLNPRALAWWFMDDGTNYPGKSLNIATNGFDFSEHELLKDYIYSTFGIGFSVRQDKRRKQFFLSASGENYRKFIKLITPYSVSPMDYKFKVLHRRCKSCGEYLAPEIAAKKFSYCRDNKCQLVKNWVNSGYWKMTLQQLREKADIQYAG